MLALYKDILNCDPYSDRWQGNAATLICHQRHADPTQPETQTNMGRSGNKYFSGSLLSWLRQNEVSGLRLTEIDVLNDAGNISGTMQIASTPGEDGRILRMHTEIFTPSISGEREQHEWLAARDPSSGDCLPLAQSNLPRFKDFIAAAERKLGPWENGVRPMGCKPVAASAAAPARGGTATALSGTPPVTQSPGVQPALLPQS